MAAANPQKYLAIADGYANGKVIKAGEAFVADFREIKRKPHTFHRARDGELTDRVKTVGDIERDKNGNALYGKIVVPTWAEPADDKEFAAALAADNQIDDPNLEAMALPGLQAYAAERGVPFDGLSKKDLVTAIKAARDFTR